jgi:uncharacterized membrane protein
MNTHSILRATMIAALYTSFTYALAPISYGPLQFRLSEALTVLPILYPEAIYGLFIGTLLANIFGGLGIWDILGGSLATLIAACLTYRFRTNILAYLSPIVVNALIVGGYLSILYAMPFWFTILSILISEAIIVFAIGYPLISILKKYKF